MKKKIIKVLRGIGVTGLTLLLSFAVSLALQEFFNEPALIPSLFVLSVFLVSLLTEGYFYGISAALISVLAVNFAFTFPYFEFNFTIPENAISAIIMIIVTAVTSALTTKLKRQEMLRAETEKEKMRANLLRAISHDLRTPLTTIYGTSSTMIENYRMLEDENKLQLLRGIQEDSQWLIRMVENLLSVTKVDEDSVRLIKSSIVVEELVDAVLQKFQKRYPGHKVELVLPDDFITVSADAILLEQVIINLLENAVQHATGMTRLQLVITATEELVEFAVVDDGCGIEKEKLNRILQGQYVPDWVSSDSAKQFMGIGLSVCATIVKAHGGTIDAKNQKDGGMCFRFSLARENMENE